MTEQNFCMRAYIGNIAYPVGSIYICGTTHDNGANYDPDVDSPWALFGGTEDDWEQLEDTMLMASGSSHVLWSRHNNSENIVLTEEQLPTHTHTINKTTDATDISKNKTLEGTVHIRRLTGSGEGTTILADPDGTIITLDSRVGSALHGLTVGSNTASQDKMTINMKHSHSINTSGSSKEIDIAPSYTVVHMWRRKHLAEVVNVDYDWPNARQ